MSAVGHYLEDEGIATTGVSLVREHSEAMQPPRALWVPFMLGRPLGAASRPAFQRDVLRAALALLAETDVPVLRDLEVDVGRAGEMASSVAMHWESDVAERAAALAEATDVAIEEGESCPVHFSRPAVAGSGIQGLAAALAEEIEQLRPWHDVAVRRRGGSTVGLSRQDPRAAAEVLLALLVDEAAAGTADGADAGANAAPGAAMGAEPAVPSPEVIKLCCDDLRSFYEEAALAQPGNLSSAALADWYYRQTRMGDLLSLARHRLLTSAQASYRFLGERVLVPRSQHRPPSAVV